MRTVEEVLGSIFMQESSAQIGVNSPEFGDNSALSRLESVYRRYGQGIYTFCLRLLANEKAAESATVDAFVRFGKEMTSQSDKSRDVLRLRELAINASLRRLNGRRTILRSLAEGLCLTLGRIGRQLTDKEVHK